MRGKFYIFKLPVFLISDFFKIRVAKMCGRKLFIKVHMAGQLRSSVVDESVLF